MLLTFLMGLAAAAGFAGETIAAPVAPPPVTLALCDKVFKGDRAAATEFEKNFKGAFEYYSESKAFYIAESRASFAKFASTAGWNEAQAQSFATTVESEDGYKTLFNEQQSLADRLEALIAKFKTATPRTQCEVATEASTVILKGAANAKAQVGYVNERVAAEAQRLGIKLSQ